jgi:hypothetical protein
MRALFFAIALPLAPPHLSEIPIARLRHPGDLGGKALDVVLFLLEPGLGYEHGKVRIADLQGLELRVEPILD